MARPFAGFHADINRVCALQPPHPRSTCLGMALPDVLREDLVAAGFYLFEGASNPADPGREEGAAAAGSVEILNAPREDHSPQSRTVRRLASRARRH